MAVAVETEEPMDLVSRLCFAFMSFDRCLTGGAAEKKSTVTSRP